MLGIKEDSRLGVIQTLWNYIKLQGLQDKSDRRVIHADDKLRLVSTLSVYPVLHLKSNGTVDRSSVQTA